MLHFVFFFSSRRRHTRCALVTGVQTCALPICYEPTLEAIAEQAVVDDEAAIVRGLSIRGTLEPSRCDNFIAVKQGPGTMAFVAVSTYRTFRISVRPNQVKISIGDRKSTRLNSSH